MNLIKATNYYLGESKQIEYIHINSEDDNASDLETQALDLAEPVVTILRGKELRVVVVYGDRVIGAMWNEMNGDVYTFDVVVHPDFKRMGIGTKLVDYAEQYFSDYKDANENAYIEAEVISPKMEMLLSKKGYVEVRRIRDRMGTYVYMRRKEDIDKGKEEEENEDD